MKNRLSRAPRAALTLAAAALATPSLGLAQASPSLQETVVTAARSEQLLVDALPHTTLIGRDAIEASQAPDLPSLLVREAGFQFTQNGGPGTSANLFLRGSASLQVLVLIDGVPMTKQDATGTVSLEHIPLDHIERVEIVRGNVSAIYGSGAVGGVIQIFTRRGEGAPRAYASTELGSYGSARASAGVSGRQGDTRFSLGVARRVTEGFSAMSAVQYPTENRDRDGYRNSSAHASLDHDWAPQQSLGLRLQAIDGRYAFDGGGFGGPTDRYFGRNQIGSAALVSHNRLGDGWTSALTLSAGRERAEYDARLTGFPYTSDATTRSRTLSWVHTVLAGPQTFTAGVERQTQQIDAGDSTGVALTRERRVTSAFAGVTGEYGPHSVQFNARRDRTDGGLTKTTGYLGYGWQFAPAWKAIASVSSAFNQPPLGYLFDPFAGNPTLRPETARSAELGLQWAADGQIVRATWFTTRIDDLLQYDFNTFSFNNVSAARNRGLEVSATGRWGRASTHASLTLQDPTDRSTGQRLIRRARALASAGLSVPVGDWTLGGDVRVSGDRTEVPGRPMLGGYALVNLQARWRVDRDWALTARVENLADRDYQTAYGYNQSGRAFFVGLQWSPR